MTLFFRLVDRLSDLAAVLSACAIIFMLGYILLEVLLRNVFGTSTYGLNEFVGYSVAAATLLVAGATFKSSEFIRIGFVAKLLGRRWPKILIALEAFLTAITLGLVFFLDRYYVKGTYEYFQRGTVSDSMARVPLWIPQAVVCVGLTVFALQLASYLVQNVLALIFNRSVPNAAALDRDCDDKRQ